MMLPDYCFLAATGPSPMAHTVVVVGAILLAAGLAALWQANRSRGSLLALVVIAAVTMSLATPLSADASTGVRSDLPECQVTQQEETKKDSSSPSSARPPASSTTEGEEALRISSRELRPGDFIIVAGAGYEPGSRVALTMFSEPTDLLPGGALVTESGRFAVEVEVPEVEDGSHSITAEGVTADGDERSGSIGVSLDGTPPEFDLESFEFTPDPNLVSVSPGDTLSFQINIRDASGIAQAGVVVYDLTEDPDAPGEYRSRVQRDSFCGQQDLTKLSGPDEEGWETWGKSCTVTESWINGDYELYFVAYDPFFLSGETPTADPLFGDLFELNTVPLFPFSVSDASDDHLGPELEIALDPSQASYAPGDSFTIEITATDETEVKTVGFRISEFMTFDLADGGTERQPIQRDSFCGQETTRRGDSDVWVAECTVTAGWINGTFTVEPTAEDTLGNIVYTYLDNPDDPTASFTITGASDDRTGPEIISISPTQGSFTLGDRIEFEIVVDDPSGVELVQIGIRDVDRDIDRYFCGFQLETRTPNQTRQTWSEACEVNWDFVHGNYEIIAYARDRLGNWTGTNNFPGSPLRGSFSIY